MIERKTIEDTRKKKGSTIQSAIGNRSPSQKYRKITGRFKLASPRPN